MQINRTSKLFLTNCYLYDITSCHCNILKNLGYNVSKLEVKYKISRNIEIGCLMRENPRLSTMLRSITNSVIDSYLNENNIKDELITRQYDGVIVTKPLLETKNFELKLELRNIFQFFLISITRDSYIAIDTNKEITIKGIPYRYEEIDNFIKRIISINFASKLSIFESMERIKNELFYCQECNVFMIPNDEESCFIFLNDYGKTKISKTLSRILDPDDIDKEKYYNFYLKPFFQSLITEFI